MNRTSSAAHELQNLQKLLPCSLIVILILRICTLEVGDLLDPTETRYATVAQHMLTSGDWVTPKLPSGQGLEAYLSKPPLHFWLTALSYSLFGIDEWSSRLPSFLSLLLITSCLLLFSKQFLTPEIGYLSSIICITSPLMFFLGGSSTVDVTFSAFTTAALVSYAFFDFSPRRSKIAGLLTFCFSALAFLTKGPASIVLIGLPIAALTIYRRDFSGISKLPWLVGTLIFVTIVVPWFLLLEKATPGATSYYFINENILRFTTKDYGGHHGAAHVRPYGSIWWMAGLSILPWLAYLTLGVRGHMTTFFNGRTNSLFIYLVCIAASPLAFFTFARSILPSYSTPAIPGISLLLASLISRQPLIGTALVARHRYRGSLRNAARYGVGLALMMSGGLVIAAPYVESQRSAGELLEQFVQHTRRARPVVATISTRDLSPYWMEGAHIQELSKPIHIAYASPRDIRNRKFRNLIVRDRRLSKEATAFLETNYEMRGTAGRWHWYRRKKDRRDNLNHTEVLRG